jgi:hypothetical protein
MVIRPMERRVNGSADDMLCNLKGDATANGAVKSIVDAK